VREPDSLRITLTDNGRGLQPAPSSPRRETGMASAYSA